jgi:UDP-2-acetamido-3-amino-2,3-dideoxy-glucuronate N-acetyltransferase
VVLRIIGKRFPVTDSRFFQHPHALVETDRVGARTRVWAFAHVLPGAAIGEDCNICDHVFIENDVRIGDRVTVKCGVQLWNGTTIEDDVFIGPNVTFTNDPFPRSRQYPKSFSKTLVRHGASIGANATILPGLTIGRGAMIGSGSVVTHDVPPNAVVMGTSARITGYTDSLAPATVRRSSAGSHHTFAVQGPRFIAFPHVEDFRGSLSFGEVATHLPFAPKRYFVIWDVPSAHVRGGHAHKSLEQVLICLRGSCHLMVDDGKAREEVELNDPTSGVYLPPNVWAVQYKYTVDAMLLVLASDKYDETDYIRDYDEFLWLRKSIS